MKMNVQVRGGVIQLVREIGSGGHGTVYLGERTGEFSQRVAVKVLRVGGGSGTEPVVLSSLDHPNIVRLLDQGGTPEGLPYLVMEYVDGVRIDQFCDDGRMRVRARMELLRKVMDGVSYAHRHLVIHADLKASNVLVDADGEPKLLDFGIARRFGGEPAADSAVDFTPAFASPEQRRQERVTVATDVYGLGVLMAVMLTGQFTTGGEWFWQDGIQGVAEARATSVTGLRRALAGELEAIFEKATEEEPEKRYASVEAFSADLRAYLEDRPIAAVPATRVQRGRKWVMRHRVMTASAAVVVAAILIAVTGVTVQTARAEYQRRVAERRLQELVRLTSALDGELYSSVQALPQSGEAKATLLRGATHTMDKLSADEVQNAALTVEMAQQYAQLARLQVSAATPTAADKKEAMEDVDKGTALLAGLHGSGASSEMQELRTIGSGLVK